jgi:RNA polymerase sigma-70 factor (ECF subfamily)
MAESDLFDTFIALRGRLSRLVRGIVPPKEVEDIVQETYVRVCQVKNKSAIREPRSFLFRTAQNLALDHLKRSESRLTTGVDSVDNVAIADLGPHTDATYEQAATDEEFVLFCEAVRDLPKQCRRAFVLKKVYGYTLKEIAVEMGIGQPTVESHIVAGTKRCVRYLRDCESRRATGPRATASSRPARRGGDA